MKTFLMVFLASLSIAHASSEARPPQDGIHAGFEICKSLPFSSDREACINIVSSAQYYDVGAVSICSERMTFSTDKLTCLTQIKNKRYQDIVIERICRTMTFSSDVSACLVQTAGKRYYEQVVDTCSASPFGSSKLQCLAQASYAPIGISPGCERREILRDLNYAIEILKQGRLGEGLSRLYELRADLSFCL